MTTHILSIKFSGGFELYVETIHDNLSVSLGNDPQSALQFNNYDQAIALANLLDDAEANSTLPEFLPMEVSCQNED